MHRHALKTALLSSTLMFMTAGAVSAADEVLRWWSHPALVLVFLMRERKYKLFRMVRPKTCSLWRKVCPRIPLSTSS